MKIGKITPLAKSVSKEDYELRKGDVFIHPTLGQMVYERHRSSKSLAAQTVIGNKPYRVGIGFNSRKYEVIGTAELIKETSDYDALRKSPRGTLFVIQTRKSVELFRLLGFKPSGKIEAENPLTGDKWGIDQNMTIKLLSNIK